MRYTIMLPLALTLGATTAFAQATAPTTLDAQYKKLQETGSKTYTPSASGAASSESLPVARDGEVIDSVGSGAIAPVLSTVKSENGINYLTGGVGDEEKAFLKEHESEYNVRLLISANTGEYLSGVKLQFTDKSGAEILSVENAGPYFFATMPEGTYSVVATSSKGLVQKLKVTAAAKAKGQVSIRFTSQPVPAAK